MDTIQAEGDDFAVQYVLFAPIVQARVCRRKGHKGHQQVFQLSVINLFIRGIPG